jgi:hypothetical protein
LRQAWDSPFSAGFNISISLGPDKNEEALIYASSQMRCEVNAIRATRFSTYLPDHRTGKETPSPILLDILGLHGNGALGAHQGFAGLMAGEGMLSITFRTDKEILFAGNISGTTLAAKFFLRFLSHLASSFLKYYSPSNHYYISVKGNEFTKLL